MARQLIEAGVSLVQVNLGNEETWDTHYTAFPNLKRFLFPPTDKAASAFLDDLGQRGLLDDTLVFGLCRAKAARQGHADMEDEQNNHRQGDETQVRECGTDLLMN